MSYYIQDTLAIISNSMLLLLLKSLVPDSGLGLAALREWARRNTGLGIRGQVFSLHSLSYLPICYDL